MYQYEHFKMDYGKLEEALDALSMNCAFSEVLRGTITNLCQIEAGKRMTLL